MEWVILFAISWVLFLTLADWKMLKKNIWCGLLAMALQTAVDSQAINHGFYSIQKAVVQIKGSSFFFVAGPIFVIGTLLAQFHPAKNWVRVLYVIVIAALFSAQEYFLIIRDVLVYHNWKFTISVVVNISAMTTLSWFSMVVLNKRGE